MDNLENSFHGLPWYAVIVLNASVLLFHNFNDYMEATLGVYYHVANFCLTSGAIIIMGFKLYEYYLKHIKKTKNEK